MALKPKDPQHALQILAGIKGRKSGHGFEFELAKLINNNSHKIDSSDEITGVFRGSPEIALIKKCLNILNLSSYDRIEAIPLGALATSENGKGWLAVNNIEVKASKSDILVNIYKDDELKTIGVSVKQCLSPKPTNPQLFLSTARAFCQLLRRNGIDISEDAEIAMSQFCGVDGCRPLDNPKVMKTRKSNPVRYYWEEINLNGRKEWESILTNNQDEITRLLLQKAYLNDPFSPEVIIQKTKKIIEGPEEFAIYSIEELIKKSRDYASFFTTLKTEVSKSKSYTVPSVLKHECPKFGLVQMQRFGNKQNATQLQFNLKAGYFYDI
jgi:hypothetical protein